MQDYTGVDNDLAYLQAELTRIDVKLRRYAQQRVLLSDNMPEPSAAFDSAARHLLQAELGANWGFASPPEAESEEAWNALYAQALQQSQELAAIAETVGHTPRLRRLAQVFGLDPFEIDVLLIALAPALDPRYAHLYAYLLDSALLGSPTIHLVLTLLHGPGLQRLRYLTHFADGAPLIKYGLIQWGSEPGTVSEPLINRGLFVDPTIVAWLLGDYQPYASLQSQPTLEEPQDSETDRLLAREVWPLMEVAGHGQSLVCLYGEDRDIKAALARMIAVRTKRPLLSVEFGDVSSDGAMLLPALRMALRDARLTNALLYLADFDISLEDRTLPVALFNEIDSHPDSVILSTKSQWQLPAVSRTQSILWLECPVPSHALRQHLWQHFSEAFIEQPQLDTTPLADQFYLNSAQIRAAVVGAHDRAIQRGRQWRITDLFAAARSQSTSHLEELAHKIVPRYGWQDLILPPDQLAILQEIAAMVRRRSQVLDEWGVGEKLVASPAVTMLFGGEPGTGKTMAAEVIARDLGHDLYKIDLSAMVSKYIGETEKNLERIFNEAEHANSILFFDEADAIFGKRTGIKDAHDRYANIGVSYLLQRMETFNGITVLATNLRANLDDAFTRRLQFVVDFPFPGPEDRLRIWETLFPPNVPHAADLDFGHLARQLKLAGGSIRNIIVAAAFLAAEAESPMTMVHLEHAVRRELQKMGRVYSEPDSRTPRQSPTRTKKAAQDPEKFYRVVRD